MDTIITEKVILKDTEGWYSMKPWDSFKFAKTVYNTEMGKLVSYDVIGEADEFHTFWLNGRRIGDVHFKCDRNPMYIFDEGLSEILHSLHVFKDGHKNVNVIPEGFEVTWKCEKSAYTKELEADWEREIREDWENDIIDEDWCNNVWE